MATWEQWIKEVFPRGGFRTRFAPSPTGYLHLGHLVNALWVWGVAHLGHGEVVFRLENHDRIRCRPEFEPILLDDLEWLNLGPSLPPPSAFRSGLSDFRQSDCPEIYEAALRELPKHGAHLYACDCSRKEILARTGPQEGEELRYDGFCRNRGLEMGPGRALRMEMPSREITFWDDRLGQQTQIPADQCGDLVLVDKDGQFTYQFSVVVDDIRHGIDWVIRGMDLLESTGRQIILHTLLGNDRLPRWLHHPLVTDSQGQKLSKRDFSTDIKTKRLAKEPVAHWIGEAAHAAGLAQIAEKLSWKEVFVRLGQKPREEPRPPDPSPVSQGKN